MNLKEVLEQSLVVLKSIQEKEVELNSQLAGVEAIELAQDKREIDLKSREEVVKDLENAKVVLQQAQKLRDAVEIDRQALVEKEVAMENNLLFGFRRSRFSCLAQSHN